MEQLETWLSAARVPLEFSPSLLHAVTHLHEQIFSLCLPHTLTQTEHIQYMHMTLMMELRAVSVNGNFRHFHNTANVLFLTGQFAEL